MLHESRHKAFMGITAGFVLLLVSRAILRSDERFAIFVVGAIFGVIGAWSLLVWGCCHYAKAKGHSGWWGLLGLLSMVGVFILFAFSDRGREVETHVTPTKELLRSLIVAEWVLIVVGVAVSFRTESLLPEPLQFYLEEEAAADITVGELVTGIALLILFIVSSIGLFFFWRPARILYVITMVVGLLGTPFFGPYVDLGWGTMFEEAAIMVSGVIVALIYFSPLKELYNKPKIAA